MWFEDFQTYRVQKQSNLGVIFTPCGAGQWPLTSGVEPRYFELTRCESDAGDSLAVFLVAVVPQAIQNLTCEMGMKHASSTQITFAFGTHSNRQMAGASTTMLHFSRGGNPKSLLRRLMSLHFWHILVIPF